MKLWRRWTHLWKTRPGTPGALPSSRRPQFPDSSPQAREAETALSDALSWLAEATRSDASAGDSEAARRRLATRLTEGAIGVARGRWDLALRPGLVWRSRPGLQWPAMALAAALAGGVLFLLRDQVAPSPQPAAKVQEVRFDPALWELDSITATPTGSETRQMIRLLER
jgi:hypothetical protein